MEPPAPSDSAGSTGSAGPSVSTGSDGAAGRSESSEATGAEPLGQSPGSSTALPADSASSREERVRRNDRLLGLAIVAVSFAFCLALSFWAKEKSEPETSQPPAPPTLQGVVGYPSSVDALESLKAARALTRRPALRSIVLDGVKADGLLDLSEAATRARFVFQSEAGEGPQPPREPGTLPKRVTCGKQNVILRSGGMVAEPDQADHPCPSGGVEALPEPQCSPRALWRHARRRQVPNDSLARMEYFRAKAGPAWQFELPGTRHRFTLYGDCKRELNGVEAQPASP